MDLRIIFPQFATGKLLLLLMELLTTITPACPTALRQWSLPCVTRAINGISMKTLRISPAPLQAGLHLLHVLNVRKISLRQS